MGIRDAGPLLQFHKFFPGFLFHNPFHSFYFIHFLGCVPQLLAEHSVVDEQNFSPEAKLERQFFAGICWFYWIAGLELFNTCMIEFANKHFAVGLGASHFFTPLIKQVFGNNSISCLLLSVTLSSLFLAIGFFSLKRNPSIIVFGLILYFLDALFMLPKGQWLGLAFHGLAAWGILKGLQGLSLLHRAGASK